MLTCFLLPMIAVIARAVKFLQRVYIYSNRGPLLANVRVLIQKTWYAYDSSIQYFYRARYVQIDVTYGIAWFKIWGSGLKFAKTEWMISGILDKQNNVISF